MAETMKYYTQIVELEGIKYPFQKIERYQDDILEATIIRFMSEDVFTINHI